MMRSSRACRGCESENEWRMRDDAKRYLGVEVHVRGESEKVRGSTEMLKDQ